MQTATIAVHWKNKNPLVTHWSSFFSDSSQRRLHLQDTDSMMYSCEFWTFVCHRIAQNIPTNLTTPSTCKQVRCRL